ncbi:MAG: cytochrome C [Alphaproteobacteria bacterium]|nr:MAG: cytochrome C [Alphaproteobacteria bacterium]
MKRLALALAALAVAATPALAEGDAKKGEKTFKKCKSCHSIANGDDVIVKGGKTGPNLYGVIGRKAGSAEGYKYSSAMVAAGEAGLVWDEEKLATFVKDPSAFLKEVTGDAAAKSKMTFKLKKGGEDVAAYLASLAAE